MTEQERLTVLYGDPALAPAERIPLQAGPLSMVYEGGDLKYIRYGRQEIVRRIYAAVRDGHWGTVPATLTEVERTMDAESFRIVYDARHVDAESGIDFTWRGTLTGTADGVVTFDLDGTAGAAFQTNRTGICVLHPLTVAGQPVQVRHGDGTEENGVFPELISPHQPYFDIAAVAHEVVPGVRASVTFVGEVFEMEDQRNWSDASYKTYSRPLDLPRPYEVAAGESVRQRVSVALTGYAEAPTEDDRIIVRVTDEGRSAGHGIGYVWSPESGAATEAAWNRVQELAPDFLYVPLDLATENWRADLAEADELASDLEADLLLGIAHPESLPDEWPATEGEVLALLLPPSAETLEKAVEILPEGSGVGGGYPVNFTELNRTRPESLDLDYLVWAQAPTVHAHDVTSILETPQALELQVKTALSFERPDGAGDAGIVVGPLTLARANRPPDARQQGLMGAAWYAAALGYALNASEAVEYVTLCELFGPRGLMDADGTPYPVFHALKAIGEVSGDTRVCHVNDPLRVAAFAGYAEEQFYLFAVNLSREEASVTLESLPDAPLTFRRLDETNTATGFSDPEPLRRKDNGKATIKLPAYAIGYVRAEVAEGDA
jgi:D-apionolactonase